ncbi:hypothetical protein OJF2_11310 [Aquisphaera giovannonii]|uniref:DUF4132 domain-containing protein n=1 Tax=Aquisphaera giovannonii TaxID=406548 RepID=A0A5B9VWN9_9BACT|nr:DUF4132 domain-containing protein [Aquisphaera giovannonii]QEH32652.1 hypothetical protein OJF2_11310 [Aquisphaera giovannonii]
MSTFRDRLKQAHSDHCLRHPAIALAVQYAETGDAGSLAKLARVNPSDYRWSSFLEGFSKPRDFDEEDRRVLEVLFRIDALPEIAQWLNQQLIAESPGEDVHATAREAADAAGSPRVALDRMTATYLPVLEAAGVPNSAGRYLLGLTPEELGEAATPPALDERHRSFVAPFGGLVDLLFAHAPDRLDRIVPAIFTPGNADETIARALLEKGGKRFEHVVAGAWRRVENETVRNRLSRVLVEHDPAGYRGEALELTRKDLAAALGRPYFPNQTYLWLLETYGAEVVEDLATYFRRPDLATFNSGPLAEQVAKTLGADCFPALAGLAANPNVANRAIAATHLIQLDDGSHAGFIRETLRKGLKDAAGGPASFEQDTRPAWIRLIAGWDASGFEDLLVGLADDRSKPIRDASARAFAKVGDAGLPLALPLLADKKKDRRLWATFALAGMGTPAAVEALEGRIDEEKDDDIRDAMLEVLDAARAARGHVVTREEVEGRVLRSEKKLKAPGAGWIDEGALPPLSYADGTPLGEQATRYLLLRQSRSKEMVPDVEARHLAALLDRKTSGDFALALLKQFLGTKHEAADRWTLAVAGMLGDDRVVPTLNRLVQEWADSSRGKMAEYAVQALALLGTDAALMTVDALALRYRTKYKNVGAAAVAAFEAAAARRGITVDELGDLVVPWLGFEPGKERVVEAGGKAFRVTIGPDWKLAYRDVEKNKDVASLPKAAPKETLDGLKAEAAILKDVAKGQKARLENLLVVQHRWPIARWRSLFLDHPVLLPFAMRLVWGECDTTGKLVGTFQALEDRSLTTARDEPYELREEHSWIGMVHPLELDAETLQAWRAHLADYEITPPFPQLDRPVIAVSDGEKETKISDRFRGTELNGMTFRGRAEKLGWTRGSVVDAGHVDAYRKAFPASGVEVFLSIEGLYMGMSREDSITLHDLCFARGGSVKVGSYTYDRPSRESDERLIPFGSIPPIVYSEVMADVGKISGKGGADDEGAD